MNDEKSYYLAKADEFGWGPQTAKINFRRAELIEKHLAGKRLLDVGCGSGIWVDYFSRRGYEATGIDFVKEFINQARKKYQGHFVLADAGRLPFKKNSFDTVLMISSLEHMADDKAALEEAGRVAKRLIIIVPQETPQALVKRGVIFKHYLDRTHKRVYSRKKLKKLLEGAGFKVKEFIETERLPAISIFAELFSAPKPVKRIATRLFFWLFKEKNYYLELMAVADRK